MAIPVRTQQELLDASGHLGYEVWMLRHTAARLSGMSPGPERNAALESFTVHARLLYQFFDPMPPTPPRADDVCAWHYVVGGESAWQTALPAMPPELADVTTRVGKEIAHLTYHRVTIGPVSNDWDVAAIRDAMLRVLATFVGAANPADLSPEFHRLTAGPLSVPGAVVASTAAQTVLGAMHSTACSTTNPVQSVPLTVNSTGSNPASPASPLKDET